MRCIRCSLPANYPGIEFNEENVCCYCLTNRKMIYKGSKELEAFIKSHENKNAEFDCVVGFSGGRDSSYTLYYLVRICGLRVLAYCADNGFVSDAAKMNMKRISEKLDIRLIFDENYLLRRCIRRNLASWLRRPCPSMIPMICSGCRLGMFQGLLEVAKANGIPLVVLGAGHQLEVCHFKKAFLTNNTFGSKIRNNEALALLFGFLYEMIMNPSYFLNPINLITYFKEYMYFFHLKTMCKLFYHKQTLLYFFEYIPWDEGVIISTIRQELGWAQDADSASSWRSDCVISILKNYLLKETVGFTEKDEILANMTRENMITTAEARRRSKTENIFHEQSFRQVLIEIGIDPTHFNAVVGAANTIYRQTHGEHDERDRSTVNLEEG